MTTPNIISTATDAINTELTGKKFFQSKTFWINMLALAGMALQTHYGYVISPEYQALILSAVNLILRNYTNEAIVWTN